MSVSKGRNIDTIITTEIKDNAAITQRNQLNTTARVRLAGKNFDGSTKDTNFWSESVANGGSVFQNGGSIVLRTGTAANGTAKYESIKKARFVAGTTNLWFIRTTVNTLAQNNLIRAGAYDDDNGLFFQIDSQSFSVGTRKNGVDTLISNGHFNGVYGINYPPQAETYFSNSIEWTPTDVLFFVQGRLLHKIEGELLSETSSLPIRLENINSNGSAENIDFIIAESAIMRQGELSTDSIYSHISGNAATRVLKYGAGKLKRFIFNNTSGTSVTIYDGVDVTGQQIGTITTTQNSIGSWEYDLPFSTGLTIVTVGDGLDATVVYE